MSSNTNNTNVAGLKFPTQKAMLSGNPRDSAIQSNTNMNEKTASLTAAVGGTRMRRMRKIRKSSKKRIGGVKRKGGAVAVPQFQMQYSDQSGPGGSPNDQVQQNSQISTQQVANASYDSAALNTKGGRHKYKKSRKLSRRKRRGGNTNSDWKWGCYSGGKKTKKRKH
jgi:hypothetical protein